LRQARLKRGRALGSAAWADVPDLTIKPHTILVDVLSQILFLGVDLAGANNIVLACRQIEVLIVLADLLKVIPGGCKSSWIGCR
jgi:hypothetical protein